MDPNPPEFPFLSNVGLMLTYRCTVTCPHCVVDAGPHRTEEMSLEDSFAWIDDACRYRKHAIKGLALTGGEPFYNVPKLQTIARYAMQRGFCVSAVTNAFWAASREQAFSILSSLPEIKVLSISTDEYHQWAIPFDHVRNLVWAAKATGKAYNLAVCTDDEDKPEFRTIMREIEDMGESGNTRITMTFPVGRAKKNARRFRFNYSPNLTHSACGVASAPVIYPGGKVMACIGPVLALPTSHPLVLGDLRKEPLSSILERAETNPILHIIRVWGPHKLVSLLKESGYAPLMPARYIRDCACDGCYQLLSDPVVVSLLEKIVARQEIQELIAYGRIFYLQESGMAERLLLRKVSQEIQG